MTMTRSSGGHSRHRLGTNSTLHATTTPHQWMAYYQTPMGGDTEWVSGHAHHATPAKPHEPPPLWHTAHTHTLTHSHTHTHTHTHEGTNARHAVDMQWGATRKKPVVNRTCACFCRCRGEPINIHEQQHLGLGRTVRQQVVNEHSDMGRLAQEGVEGLEWSDCGSLALPTRCCKRGVCVWVCVSVSVYV